MYDITSTRALRTAFWRSAPDSMRSQRRTRKTQNEYNADIRSAWVDYVDHMHRSGYISDRLANQATL